MPAVCGAGFSAAAETRSQRPDVAGQALRCSAAVASEIDHGRLEARLGHRFADPELLVRALTHSSWANEQRAPRPIDNQKLEFLGDAVLALVVGHGLIEAHPHLGEGELSVARAQVVSEGGLAAAARDLSLGDFLRLGRGEDRSGGRDKPSLLADAFEAVVAAVYLDAGFAAAIALVGRLLGPRIAEVDETGFADAKTRLQEAAQASLKATPEYKVVAESGPPHDRTFEVAVMIDGREWSRATGKASRNFHTIFVVAVGRGDVQDGLSEVCLPIRPCFPSPSTV
jgi:ribonuclease-3